MEIVNEGPTVRVVGDLDVSTARQLDAHEASVYDVSGVTFMDCAGIAALLRARDRARARGMPFALEGVDGPVARVLEITQLEDELRR
jgi:anti-anti-sigma factor